MQSLIQVLRWLLPSVGWKMMVVILIGLSAGCADLQIDVDVYKGALSNEKEIEIQQFAVLAIAAKPAIARLRNELEKAERDRRSVLAGNNTRSPDYGYDGTAYLHEIVAMGLFGKYCACDERFRSDSTIFWRSDTARFLNDVLQSYDDPPDRYPDPGNNRRGIETLYREFSELPVGTQSQAVTGLDNEASSIALGKLERAMIPFAQRLLFVINNTDLIVETKSGKWDNKWVVPLTASLESLSNSILLYANDLQRQRRREAEMSRKFNAELSGATRAFNLSPAAAYDTLLSEVRRNSLAAIGQVARVAPAASAASASASAAASEEASAEQQAGDAHETVAKTAETLAPLKAAYRTLVVVTTGEARVFAPADAAAEARDQKVVFKRLTAAATTNATAETLVAEMKDWIDREVGGPAKEGPRMTRLKSTRQFLDTNATELGKLAIDPQPRASLIPAMQQLIRRWSVAAVEQQILVEQVAKSQDQLLRHSTIKSAGAGEKSRALQARADSAAKAMADYGTAFAMFDRVRDDVLRQPIIGTQEIVPSMFATLKSMLKGIQSGTGTAQDRGAAGVALGLLANVNVPATFPFGKGDYTKQNDEPMRPSQVDVLDDVIILLRHQRIQAVAAGEPTRAHDYLSAINIAYEQRAALMYLRPASDYLRSIYAATALQDDPDPTYRDMLFDYLSYLKPAALEDISVKDTLSPNSSYQRKINEAKRRLEKSAWQNINRVSLAGGGFTNFVLAKDDVGNWYVKAYGSDPEPIIKAAQSLALFNTGQRIDVNLLHRLDLQRKLDASRSSSEQEWLQGEIDKSPAPGDAARLTKVHDRFATQYAQATSTQTQRLDTAMTTLDASSLAAVQASLKEQGVDPASDLAAALSTSLTKDQTDDLKESRAAIAAAMALDASDTSRVGQLESAFAQSLSAMIQFRKHAHSLVVSSSAVSGKDQAVRDQAAQAVDTTINSRIKEFAELRRSTMKTYEDALIQIGDVGTSP